jgi:hypothetical protein
MNFLRRILEDNIKINIKDVGRKGVGWIHLVELRPVVKTSMNAPVPWRGWNFLKMAE